MPRMFRQDNAHLVKQIAGNSFLFIKEYRMENENQRERIRKGQKKIPNSGCGTCSKTEFNEVAIYKDGKLEFAFCAVHKKSYRPDHWCEHYEREPGAEG